MVIEPIMEKSYASLRDFLVHETDSEIQIEINKWLKEKASELNIDTEGMQGLSIIEAIEDKGIDIYELVDSDVEGVKQILAEIPNRYFYVRFNSFDDMIEISEFEKELY